LPPSKLLRVAETKLELAMRKQDSSIESLGLLFEERDDLTGRSDFNMPNASLSFPRKSSVAPATAMTADASIDAN
jgi:hypothetical protein